MDENKDERLFECLIHGGEYRENGTCQAEVNPNYICSEHDEIPFKEVFLGRHIKDNCFRIVHLGSKICGRQLIHISVKKPGMAFGL